MTKETANVAFYDADSATYDEQRWASPAGEHTNRVQQSILGALTAGWSGRVLEVGPGTARFSIPLCRRDLRLTLVDIAPGMLETARRNVEAAGVGDRVEGYVEGSIYELPFEDGSFDHAISLNVFNHLERGADALRQLARVTRPGSTLLFNYANLRSWYWAAGRRINRQRTAVGQDVYSVWRKPAEVRAMIEAAGLELVRGVGHVHVPRAAERFHVLPVARLLDRVSRAGPLRTLAPVQYCLCRRGSS